MDAVVMICLKRPNNTMLLLTSTEKGKLGMMLKRDCCLVLPNLSSHPYNAHQLSAVCSHTLA